MNLRPKPPKPPDINLTPLIDVVFLMLIFFMVSTTFEKESSVKVNLPKASSDKTTPDTSAIEITINAQGEYFINRSRGLGRHLGRLKTAIIKQAGTHRDQPFIIRADAKAPHQSVVTVMDIAGQLGFHLISIPTTQTTDSPPGQ